MQVTTRFESDEDIVLHAPDKVACVLATCEVGSDFVYDFEFPDGSVGRYWEVAEVSAARIHLHLIA